MTTQTEWPKDNLAALTAFYGRFDLDGEGMPTERWERQFLTTITPPYRMVTAWKDEKGEQRPINRITCHQEVASSLHRILGAILDHYETQEAIEKARMHLYGGMFNFRRTRGGSRLSVHSWAAAIDLDPDNNGLGRPWKANTGMMPEAVIEIFKSEGWFWGGDFKSRPDPMHFQAAIP